ncbi:MAG: aldehyde dehydrogenase family protein [Bacteroidales bacterium]|nr:aldehyde dehydrogenase family protein [Bacteroidales bacterium]
MNNKRKIYAGGYFIDTSVYKPIRRPFDGLVIGEAGFAGEDELETAIQAALQTEGTMADLPVYKRHKILLDIVSGMEKKRELLAGLLAQEAGKPLRYAEGEVARAMQTFKVAAEESLRLPGEYLRLDWTPAGEAKEGWVKYFPVGTIAGISPFNFPLNLSVHKIAPAIAAGNPVILKPASQTPMTILELAGIIDQTELPKGSLSILPMDRQTGNKLVTDRRIKMLSFTGSPVVGWKMKQQAGMKKILLELGGNAGVLITGSADLDLAVAKCLIGGFAYSGQVCIHAQRLFVEKSVFNEFAEKFVAGVKQLKYGDPLDPDTEISVMIDEENAIRVEDWIQEAVNDGANILTGGKRKGTYIEPTVLTQTKAVMKVCSLEVFGPVVTLEPVPDFTTGIGRMNESEYGLQAGVFTNDFQQVNQAFNELQVGGVIINDVPTFRVDHMPYGGVKKSGSGREGLKYSIREMMEPKLLVKPIK